MAYDQLKLERQLCFRLYTASRLTTQTYEPFLKQLGITYTQYLVLLVLWEKDDQPINDIGKTLLLGINTISPLIKRMETQDLVARHNSDKDKRQQLVYLTSKGKEMKEKAAKIPGYMLDAMNENNVDAEALSKLIPVLDDYIQKLKETE
ncbi:MarR family winged helix-turn-helix transcriptional regulator [Hoylesella nanceiensis]|uniref:MarR family winged helix-turn-helix transcriptional regulator n=1 Tax=Hoylesella nanceiensis TaxID=425941 RepID=UPI00242F13F0|nr:MarR family transcriptional regulator [Hoylesella nanceiensis]